jgi:hypothetical protein
VMTFMMNQDGVLLQKDLGKSTVQTATAMTEYDPDSSWSSVEQRHFLPQVGIARSR